MKFKKFLKPLLLAVLITSLSTPLWAGPKINIVVKTVLASQDAEYTDPRLSSLIRELKSVFRYSSYRLLSQDSMNPSIGETDSVSLPGNRVLRVTPVGIKGNRVEFRLEILKNRQQIFQTVFKLLNRSSITVGGPKHKKGYLLFNISGSF